MALKVDSTINKWLRVLKYKRKIKAFKSGDELKQLK